MLDDITKQCDDSDSSVQEIEEPDQPLLKCVPKLKPLTVIFKKQSNLVGGSQ
jgi:hypothetical protein